MKGEELYVNNTEFSQNNVFQPFNSVSDFADYDKYDDIQGVESTLLNKKQIVSFCEKHKFQKTIGLYRLYHNRED